MKKNPVYLKFTTLTDPLPDFIYKELKDFSRNANGYRSQPPELIEKLAVLNNIPKEYLLLTAGADEGIQLFGLTFGKSVYIFPPTYVVYADMKDFFATVHQINAMKESMYEIPIKNIPDASLIYIANPSNPFGLTSREKIIEIIKNNSQAIIVVDEVYAEFMDVSVIDLVLMHKNLAVLRSFSKTYGMAGNRIGYIAANPDVIAKIRLKVQWANVSYLSVGAAIAALNHREYFMNNIEKLKKRRDRFAKFLKSQGFILFPTFINAVLLKFNTESDASRFVQHLSDNNFIVNHGNGMSTIGLDLSFVRISIGNDEEMRQVAEVIKKYQQ